MKLLLIFPFLFTSVLALNNGLALTPPMGWMSWERFRCNIDCKDDPDNCVSENLYMKMADLMASEGYKDVGYQYVSIDDCWLAHQRDAEGRMVPDPERFPNGMLNLAKYIHSRGLKFGMYQDFGHLTCAGYPGSEFYMKIDADTFAEWEIDMLKFDGCYSDVADMKEGYPAMSFFLNKTGRPIMFACEWPLYQVVHGQTPNYTEIKQYCNMYRNYDDVTDSWDSISSILKFYGMNNGSFAEVAGPGGFTDPDEVIVGDFGLSHDQAKAHFGMWALMASPLFMSVDLRTITPEAKAILQNKRVIAINQDPLGAQGIMPFRFGSLSFWRKPLAAKGSFALAFLNTDNQGKPTHVSIMLKQILLTDPRGYNITEAFDGTKMGIYHPNDNLTVFVNPTSIFLATALLLP